MKQTTAPSLPLSSKPKTFITAYGPKLKISITFPAEGMAKQSFKAECDINQIMARYLKTGVLDFVNKLQPQYADVTGFEYQEAMDIVATSKTLFAELPATVRERFNNNPGEFLDFVHDPANVQEMHELGLMRPDYQPPAPDAPAAVVAAPAAVPAAKPTPAKPE